MIAWCFRLAAKMNQFVHAYTCMYDVEDGNISSIVQWFIFFKCVECLVGIKFSLEYLEVYSFELLLTLVILIFLWVQFWF